MCQVGSTTSPSEWKSSRRALGGRAGDEEHGFGRLAWAQHPAFSLRFADPLRRCGSRFRGPSTPPKFHPYRFNIWTNYREFNRRLFWTDYTQAFSTRQIVSRRPSRRWRPWRPSWQCEVLVVDDDRRQWAKSTSTRPVKGFTTSWHPRFPRRLHDPARRSRRRARLDRCWRPVKHAIETAVRASPPT
jgi:hypothetical protein